MVVNVFRRLLLPLRLLPEAQTSANEIKRERNCLPLVFLTFCSNVQSS